MPDVVLPVLNELEALPWVLARMPAGYEPIVVDNGSTDGSGALAAALGARVVHEPRPGFGAACFAGLRAARADVVCFMDCDASLDPRELPLVADPVAAGDADLDARRADAGAFAPHARLANRVLALELRRRTGVRLSDLGPMRAARREALLALGHPRPAVRLAAGDGPARRRGGLGDPRGPGRLLRARRAARRSPAPCAARRAPSATWRRCSGDPSLPSSRIGTGAAGSARHREGARARAGQDPSDAALHPRAGGAPGRRRTP